LFTTVFKLFYPLILNSHILYQLIEERDVQFAASLSQTSESSGTPLDQNPVTFLIELLSNIFSSYGLEIGRAGQPDSAVLQWLDASTFSTFLCQLLLETKDFQTLFPALFYSAPFFDKHRNYLFTAHLLQTYCAQLKASRKSQNLGDFLEFLLCGVNENLFADDLVAVWAHLFDSLPSIDSILKFAELLNILFIGLFTYCRPFGHDGLVNVVLGKIEWLCKILAAAKSQDAWLYACSLMSAASSKCSELISRITTAFRGQGVSQKAFESFQEQFAAKVRTKQQTLSNLTSYLSDVKAVSRSVADVKYTANKKAFHAVNKVRANLFDLEGRFAVSEEKMKWARFMTSIRNQLILLSHFSPKCYHLAPRYLPFRIPLILTPSVFPPPSRTESAKKIPPDVIWTFEHHSASRITDPKAEGLRKLFESSYLELGACTLRHAIGLLRYASPIDCALFGFASHMLILTYATLRDGEFELVSMDTNATQLHVFLEGVFMDHWGPTCLFAGRVVIKVPLDSILFVQYQERSTAIWSLLNGHFLVKSADPLSLRRYLRELPAWRDIPAQLRRWETGELSTASLLLAVNGLRGRSFADLTSYPLMPGQSTRRLSTVLPFRYFDQPPNATDCPLNFCESFVVTDPLPTSRPVAPARFSHRVGHSASVFIAVPERLRAEGSCSSDTASVRETVALRRFPS
jgi:hypothetical protein